MRTHNITDESPEPGLANVKVDKDNEDSQLRGKQPGLLQLVLKVYSILSEDLDKSVNS